ncbi:DUF1559 domain-containing protein [Rubinisphaera sp. JC750]|uniref:DUF1559 family PulG-like putative transporter n=1 Tax=Rubinisphaera sp. JC750 TaxID=2898658 RepID=UPI001F3489D1|nr:DUF1559 domain-containing protein [Rubinisphaera sp. JC750]
MNPAQTRQREKWSVIRIATFAAILIVAYLLYKSVRATLLTLGRMARHSQCKTVVMALHQYYDDYETLPPAVVRNEQGQPFHSWRVLLMPYLDAHSEHPSDYSYSHAWDSERNATAHLGYIPAHGKFCFLAVTGPQTAWPPDGPMAMSDITDGLSETVLAIGVPGTMVRWTEPTDLVLEGATLRLRGEPIDLNGVFFVLMANGEVRFYPEGLPDGFIPAAFTPAAGDETPAY